MSEFVYGKLPNDYLKEQLEKLPVGKILLGKRKEGMLCMRQHLVGSFSIWHKYWRQNKALLLAKSENVSIDYQVGELESLTYTDNQFDVVALIYAHFPSQIKSLYHKKLTNTSGKVAL